MVGSRTIEGSRSDGRCSASLLSCLRDRASGARDEVLDALWPEFDPADALNSLNQTVYFLRRVFEPTFQEDLSPGICTTSRRRLAGLGPRRVA